VRKSVAITEVLPSLSLELQALLIAQGEPELAVQVPEMRVLDRCRCGHDFCGMFYVKPKPTGSYGPGHRNVELAPAKGMLVLNVVDNVIVAVEVLYRDEIRKKLVDEFP
jgi:hypothetical protein